MKPPFQVLCIQQPDGSTANVGFDNRGKMVQCMSEYTVKGVHYEYGRTYFFLYGMPDDMAWRDAYFATLPGLSADEMAAIEKEAIIK